MLKTKVKAGNITNLSDARYCAGMGVDWLGFPMESIDPKTFTEITSWVNGPQFVLEIASKKLPDSISQYPVNILQISYPLLKESESLSNQSVIISLSMNDWPSAKIELLKYSHRISYLLVTGLTGFKAEDDALLKEMSQHFEILADLQKCPYELNKVLEFPVAGVNLSGNPELKPGLKDYTVLAEVLEQLESE